MGEVPGISLISPILNALEKIVAWLQIPQMESVEPKTKYGWLESLEGPPMLLVTVKFRNEREKPITVRSLQVKYGNSWLQPKDYQGDGLHLLYRPKQYEPGSLPHQHGVGRLDPNNNILNALFIPPSTVVERFALFDLPITGTMLPHHVEFTAKAKFSNGRSRSLSLSLTNAI
jgi:hypothetical protein